MLISTVSFYRYDLPLTAPLQLAGMAHPRRRGLLVRLETERGTVGWGDAAPLPGFSVETLSDVLEHACAAAPEWSGTHIPGSEEDLHHSLSALAAGPDCPASLRFAAESALVHLRAVAQERSLPDVLGKPRSSVSLNALITNPEHEGAAQAVRLREEGYRAVKVKVGRKPIAAEIEWLRAIREALGDDIALRADANRAWSLEQAVAFAEATQTLRIAYIEEPLTDPTRISELAARTEVPIALDETTREGDVSMLREDVSVTAVILKPTLLGGLRATRQWSRAARANDVTPVISAAYESGIGLRMLVALAATEPDTSVGLSTYDRLAADVISSRLPLEGPVVDVASITDASVSVDDDRIIRVDSFSS